MILSLWSLVSDGTLHASALTCNWCQECTFCCLHTLPIMQGPGGGTTALLKQSAQMGTHGSVVRSMFFHTPPP